MNAFLAKRLITLIATLIGASVVVFVVLEILPGNAAQILMGPDAFASTRSRATTSWAMSP